MRRLRKLSLVLASLAIAAVFPAPPARALSIVCERPNPKMTYSSDAFIISIRVDLDGCDWWKGREILLEGELERDRGVVAEGMAAMKVCGALTFVSRERKAKPRRVTSCGLRLALDHQPIEIERYSGSFSYPWRDGRETVEFAYSCVSTPVLAECEEQ